MDSEENYSIKSSMKVQFKKRVSKRHKSTSTSTDSDSDKEKNIKYKKSKSRIKAHIKKTLHSHKHKHKKRRSRSSSSDSSSSVDSSTSSTEINSSSTSEEERKRRKKINKRLLKKRMKKTKKNASSKIDEGSSNDIPLELMSGGRSLTPMTKEEWEKKQSVVRRVYDETTGRNRLIKGDGEVIEEIVSRERHKQINEQATKGDGDFFQKHLKKM